MSDLKPLGINNPSERLQRQVDPAADRLLINTLGPSGGAAGPLVVLPVTPVTGSDHILEVSAGKSTVVSVAPTGILNIAGSVAQPSYSFRDSASSGFLLNGGYPAVSSEGILIAQFSASQGESAQLRVTAGSAAAPGLSGLAELDTGLYWASDQISVTAAGVPVATFQAPLGAEPQILLVSGSASAPSIGFSAQSGTGLFYSSGIRFSISGLDRAILDGSKFSPTTNQGLALGAASQAWGTGYINQVLTGNGSAAAAAHGFINAGNTGMYLVGADQLHFTSAGADVATFMRSLDNSTGDETSILFTTVVNKATSGNYTGIRLDVTETSIPGSDNRLLDLRTGGTTRMHVTRDGAVRAYAGSPGVAGLGFTVTSAAGMRYAGGGVFVLAGGADKMQFAGSATVSYQPIWFPDGSAGAPAVTFTGDTDTGIYRPASDQLAVSTGGVQAALIQQALVAATGDETSISLFTTVNKATSGNYTGLKLNVTETSAPGTDNLLIDLLVGNISKFHITNDGLVRAGDSATNGLAAAPHYSFGRDIASGFYFTETLLSHEVIGVSLSGTSRWLFYRGQGESTAIQFHVTPGNRSDNDPAIAAIDDTNTGIGFPTFDQVAISTGGWWAATFTGLLAEATGDEVGIDFAIDVNKASGNYTGIRLNVTETLAPGTDDRLIDLLVGGSSMFHVGSTGNAHLGPPGSTASATRSLFFNSGDGTNARQPEITAGTSGTIAVLAHDNTGLRINTNAVAQGVGSSAGKWTLQVANDGVGLRYTSRLTTATATEAHLFSNSAFGTPFSASSGRQTFGRFSVVVNQSGTAEYTGLTVDVTETTLGGTDNRLLDLQVGAVSQTYITNTGQTRSTDGSAATPTFSFISDVSSGLYRPGAKQVGISVQGTLRALFGEVDSTLASNWMPSGTQNLGGPGVEWSNLYVGAVQSSSHVALADGAVGTPALRFSSDPNTGLWRIAADTMGISAGGTEIARLLINVGIPQIQSAQGTAAQPVYTFFSDPDTGFYNPGANQLAISAGGSLRVNFASTEVLTTVPIRVSSGSEGAPGYSFNSDNDTGFYRPGADQLRAVAGAGTAMTWTTTSVSSHKNLLPNSDATYTLGSTTQRWSESHNQKRVTKTTAVGYTDSDARLETANVTTPAGAGATTLWSRTLVADQAIDVLVQVIAEDDSGSEQLGQVFHIVAYHDGVNAVLRHAKAIDTYQTDVNWFVQGDVSASDVILKVTGSANQDTYWHASVRHCVIKNSAL